MNNTRYEFTSNLDKMCEVLYTFVPVEDRMFVRSVHNWGKMTTFLTHKQMVSLGGLWKRYVNDDQYVLWDWWPDSKTHCSKLLGK